MPRQNRVQPTGEILAHPARGLLMGNRGILHDDSGQLGHARWRHKAWVCCVTDFKNRKRPLMTPGAYTELFFHDEAVALAAGHRPCAECRRPDFRDYLQAVGHVGKVTEFDKALHAARAVPRVFGQRRHQADMSDLPEGTFFLTGAGVPNLIWQQAAHPFLPQGYQPATALPVGEVTVLTPTPSLNALRNGFQPQVRLRHA
ncbi:hypothetical protein SAMN05444000_103110 [Shimia gijangensis]|uniref:Metal binding domain of Ada n=1 Tax=Shimia gijangensis TaxID=1470563 RepID=A0A1M6E573_9RHOB|nr:hypothetical protein [Shimia gijangensis]SHI80555.1 hypothetical protein SAMN05444000_103110 [Shimia gijangensis]